VLLHRQACAHVRACVCVCVCAFDRQQARDKIQAAILKIFRPTRRRRSDGVSHGRMKVTEGWEKERGKKVTGNEYGGKSLILCVWDLISGATGSLDTACDFLLNDMF